MEVSNYDIVEILKTVGIGNLNYYWEYIDGKPIHKKERLTDKKIIDHTNGETIIGNTPFIDNLYVKFGSFDLDCHLTESMTEEEKNAKIEEIITDTKKISNKFSSLNLSFFVNVSGRGNGRHIRIYVQKELASKVRIFLAKILLEIFGELKYEIFPAQDFLDSETRPYGNQMKLFLGVHPKTKKQTLLIEDNKILTVDESLKKLNEIIDNFDKYSKIQITEADEEIFKKEYNYNPEITNTEVPICCPFIEKIASQFELPQGGEIKRHFYIDPNVLAYTYNRKDKYEYRLQYLEKQDKKDTALDNWKKYWINGVPTFSCGQIISYIQKRKKESSALSEGLKICTKCVYYNEHKNKIISKLIEDINTTNETLKSIQIKEILEILTEVEDNIVLEDFINKIKYKTKNKFSTLNKEVIKIKKEFSEKRRENSNNVIIAIDEYFDKIHLAKQFIKIQPIFYDNSQNWWIWNFKEYKWELTDKTNLLIAINNSSRADTINTQEKTEILEALQQVGRQFSPKKPDKSWIQFKDQIINIYTGEKFKATSEYFFTNPIPWELGESEETPKIDKLFREWVVSEEEGDKWVKTLYEFLAFCLIPDYSIHTCIALLGRGSNGKSTFCDLIERLVGKDNVTTANLDRLITNRFESWNLYKKLVCTMGEINFGVLKDTETFKKLTGQDNFAFESKGKNQVIEKNYAKLVIATNTLPETFDKNIGFYRRWLLIDFPHQFPIITNFLDKTIPEYEYRNLCKKLVSILRDVLNRGEFTNQGDVSERMKRYEERANPLNNFLSEYCVEDSNSSEPYWKVYEIFEDYLIMRGLRKQSKIEFSRGLKSKNIKITTPIPTNIINKENKQQSWKFISGIKLKENDIVEDKLTEAIKIKITGKQTNTDQTSLNI